MATILKLKYGDEVLRIPIQHTEQLQYSDIFANASKSWPNLPADLVATYRDEEEDLCTLTPETLTDFLEVAATDATGRKLLKVEFVRRAPKSAGNVVAAAASSSDADHGCHWWPQKSQKDRANKKFMKQLGVLAQMRAAGALSGPTVASLIVHNLPKFQRWVAKNSGYVDEQKQALLDHGRPLLEGFRDLVLRRAGLERLEEPLGALASGAGSSEALLTILGELAKLPFEEQIDLVATLFNAHQDWLQQLLDAYMPALPWWASSVPMVHSHITCDGCNASPLRGPRFRSKDRPDYDLCGECYAHSQHHSGEQSNHRFQCVLREWHWHGAQKRHHGGEEDDGVATKRFRDAAMAWKGMWKGMLKGDGKGFCKGKGNGKGKCKGKGKFLAMLREGQEWTGSSTESEP